MGLTNVSIAVNNSPQIWVYKLDNDYTVSDRYSEPGIIRGRGYRNKEKLMEELTRQLEIILDEQLG